MQTTLPEKCEISKKKLLDEVRRILRLKHYSIRTGQAYLDWNSALPAISPAEASARNGRGGGERVSGASPSADSGKSLSEIGSPEAGVAAA